MWVRPKAFAIHERTASVLLKHSLTLYTDLTNSFSGCCLHHSKSQALPHNPHCIISSERNSELVLYTAVPTSACVELQPQGNKMWSCRLKFEADDADYHRTTSHPILCGTYNSNVPTGQHKALCTVADGPRMRVFSFFFKPVNVEVDQIVNFCNARLPIFLPDAW